MLVYRRVIVLSNESHDSQGFACWGCWGSRTVDIQPNPASPKWMIHFAILCSWGEIHGCMAKKTPFTKLALWNVTRAPQRRYSDAMRSRSCPGVFPHCAESWLLVVEPVKMCSWLEFIIPFLERIQIIIGYISYISIYQLPSGYLT